MVPRSIQEIIEHADELARSFEEFESGEASERPVPVYLLQRAVVARAQGERQVMEAVAAARAAGVPWAKIGEILGTSAQAAHQRYGGVVEQV